MREGGRPTTAGPGWDARRVPADLPFPTSDHVRRPADPARSAPDAGAGPDRGDADGDSPSEDGPPRTVRLAWATDAPAVAAVQHDDYRRALAGTGTDVPDAAELQAAWLRAITRPPTARHRVLVAVEDGAVRGFVATGPAEDPDSDLAVDGDVLALHAVRDAMRPDLPDTPAGGGPELLAALAAAAADTLAADGFTRAQHWVPTTDDLLRRVLQDAGWTPDGAHRSLTRDDIERPDGADSSDAGGSDAGGSDAGSSAAVAGALSEVRLHVGLD